MHRWKRLTVDEIMQILAHEDNIEGQLKDWQGQALLAELIVRSTKPHWTQINGYWVGVATCIVSFIFNIVVTVLSSRHNSSQ